MLIETTRAEEGLWLVPVGPLTNVALALRRPRSRRTAGRHLPHGRRAQGGNVTAAAEFNAYADPEAAAITFRPGVRCGCAGSTSPTR